jgi:hypothetical protein
MEILVVIILNGNTIDGDLTGLDLIEMLQERNTGAFASSTWTHQGHHFPRLHFK